MNRTEYDSTRHVTSRGFLVGNLYISANNPIQFVTGLIGALAIALTLELALAIALALALAPYHARAGLTRSNPHPRSRGAPCHEALTRRLTAWAP